MGSQAEARQLVLAGNAGAPGAAGCLLPPLAAAICLARSIGTVVQVVWWVQECIHKESLWCESANIAVWTC